MPLLPQLNTFYSDEGGEEQNSIDQHLSIFHVPHSGHKRKADACKWQTRTKRLQSLPRYMGNAMKPIIYRTMAGHIKRGIVEVQH